MPIDDAERGRQAAGFGVFGLYGASAGGTGLQRRRQGLLRLALQGLLQEFAAELFAELDDGLFDVVQCCSPRWSLGAIEMVKQVFGSGLEDGPEMGRNLYGCGPCFHLELLSTVAQ